MAIEFSFPRLIQLIRRQWLENAKMYILSILGLICVTAFLMWVWVYAVGNDYYEETTYFMFIIGLYICGFVYAGFSFHALSEKTKATYWLSAPASHLEKLLVVIFYSTVLFILAYCLIFFSIRAIAVAHVKELVLSNPKKYTFYPVNWTNSFQMVFNAFMYGFVAIQAFYLLGSVYFTRYSIVLTTILGVILISVFIYYTAELSISFLGREVAWEGTSVKTGDPDGRFYRVFELSPFVTGFLIFIAKFIWAPVFWVATWYRLKEKQV